jgi:hypothetical protein
MPTAWNVNAKSAFTISLFTNSGDRPLSKTINLNRGKPHATASCPMRSGTVTRAVH